MHCKINEQLQITYSVTETAHNGVIFYGICVKERYADESIEAFIADDICTDYSIIYEFIKSLCEGKVTIATVMDCIEDFVAQL